MIIMSNNYYNDIYLKKLEHYGTYAGDKIVERGVKEFEKYLTTTPTRQTIIKDDEFYNVSIQTSSQSAEGDRYEKRILASLSDNFKVGDIFEWEQSNWIILTQEKLTIPTHFKGKIRHCNRSLKWQYQGVIHTIPAHIITRGSLALDTGKTADLAYEEGGIVISAIVPQNDITNTINRYQRFIIKGKAWQVVGIDSVSVDHLLFIRMEEDQINLASDDLQNEIADYKQQVDDTNETVEAYEYSLQGKHTLVWNSNAIYTGWTNKENIILQSFSIEDEDLATIVETNLEDSTIKIRANSSGLIGSTNLVWNVDGVEITKEIKVVSLWGE